MTNGSRGTANAWHFYHALAFCGYGVMRKLGYGVGCPLTGRYVLERVQY
ncbi:DUF3265 domain-containing protein [Vibrio vulnificus]|nr:DUF3265 domain-containing protein [Vibrio vulnificus]EIJ0944042.1 DUF3265 domain-containing protein [Vibrio vulnificus]